jgi:4-amino-4-deoxy-L-arabinose transferase-like glycosyltransferase
LDHGLLAGAGVALVLVAYVWLALSYATATPPWNNPDEPAHYNYVAHVARTGTLPVLQPGDWDSDLLERLKASQFRSDEGVERLRYEAWQPPLYYLLAAQVYRAVPAESPYARIHALRIFDIALGALTLIVAYLVAREVFTPSASARPSVSPSSTPPLSRSPPLPLPPSTALAVPTAMAGVPMFTAMSAAITNDALANLLAALLTLVLVGLVDRPATTRSALLLGALLGLALLTKLSLIVFVPLGLASLVVGAWRCRQSMRHAAICALVALAVMFVLLVPWLVRQGLTYGWDDLLASKRHEAVVVGQPRFPGLSWDYVRHWTTTFFHSFWAQFGWMGIPATDRLYWAWGAATLAACVGLLVRMVRFAESRASIRCVDPRPALLAAICVGILAVIVYYNLTFEQAQGRYLFPALPSICTLLVLGWSAPFPIRHRASGVILAALALVALNAYTLTRVLVPAFTASAP